MGARTQLFIEAVTSDGKVENYLYRQQWGGGSGLANRLMALFHRIGMLSWDEEENGFDFDQFFCEDANIYKEYKKLHDENVEWEPSPIVKYKHDKMPFEVLNSLLMEQDNDDGYLVIRLLGKDGLGKYAYKEIAAGIYDWEKDEDERYYLKFMDPINYLRRKGEDEEYIDYFKGFLKYVSKRGELFEDVFKNWDSGTDEKQGISDHEKSENESPISITGPVYDDGEVPSYYIAIHDTIIKTTDPEVVKKYKEEYGNE